MDIKKVKMKRIKPNTLLAPGDQVYLKFYRLQFTLLNDLTDGFIVHNDTGKTTTYLSRKALENHFLKI